MPTDFVAFTRFTDSFLVVAPGKDTVRLTRNPTASLEREASHTRVEGRVLYSLLASATRTRIPRVKTRVCT